MARRLRIVFVAEKLRAAGLAVAIVPGRRAESERELAHIRGDDWQFGAVEMFGSSCQERALVVGSFAIYCRTTMTSRSSRMSDKSWSWRRK